MANSPLQFACETVIHIIVRSTIIHDYVNELLM